MKRQLETDETSADDETIKLNAYEHHIRRQVCTTRSRYRRGGRDTAVKVFTIAQESAYLLVHNVPDIRGDVRSELAELCGRFGELESIRRADYPDCEPFSAVYVAKYRQFAKAVYAKKKLDDHNFLGAVLHVCYAPELETVDETRLKLSDRQRYVNHKLAEIESADK